jgi:hypothetical protein
MLKSILARDSGKIVLQIDNTETELRLRYMLDKYPDFYEEF